MPNPPCHTYAMDNPQSTINVLIEKFLIEEDREALHEACRMAATGASLDIASLLDFTQTYPAERAARAEALRRLRAALQLPPMPGPVCRPTPFD